MTTTTTNRGRYLVTAKISRSAQWDGEQHEPGDVIIVGRVACSVAAGQIVRALGCWPIFDEAQATDLEAPADTGGRDLERARRLLAEVAVHLKRARELRREISERLGRIVDEVQP